MKQIFSLAKISARGVDYIEEKGEAAFYGPKMDFKVRDSIGREWQLSTIQFDFNLPSRFDMNFVNGKGEQERPFVIHRALLGSLERFMGILIEHYGGAFPAWLAPVQAAILPVAKNHENFSQELLEKIKKVEGRAEIFDSTETLGKRIREAQTRKLPFAVIIGDDEMNGDQLTIRKYGEQKDEKISVEEFLKILQN